jgi:hypothetical protein
MLLCDIKNANMQKYGLELHNSLILNEINIYNIIYSLDEDWKYLSLKGCSSL